MSNKQTINVSKSQANMKEIFELKVFAQMKEINEWREYINAPSDIP
jgi:hypothetical protein